MTTAIISWLRTIVPIGVGAAVSWLLTLGVELDADTQAGLIAGLTGVLIALYYTVARALESKWPVFGVLLGVAKTPDSYSKGDLVEVDAGVVVGYEPALVSAEPLPTDPDTPLYYAVLDDHRP